MNFKERLHNMFCKTSIKDLKNMSDIDKVRMDRQRKLERRINILEDTILVITALLCDKYTQELIVKHWATRRGYNNQNNYMTDLKQRANRQDISDKIKLFRERLKSIVKEVIEKT